MSFGEVLGSCPTSHKLLLPNGYAGKGTVSLRSKGSHFDIFDIHICILKYSHVGCTTGNEDWIRRLGSSVNLPEISGIRSSSGLMTL